MEERSEVREEGTKSAVRDGLVPGRPPPPTPGFGVRDSVVCESLCESCPHCCAYHVRRVVLVCSRLSVTPRPRRWRPLPYIFPFPACSFHALSTCNDSLLQIIIVICDSISSRDKSIILIITNIIRKDCKEPSALLGLLSVV